MTGIYWNTDEGHEYTREVTVYCGNEDCAKHDVELDAEITGTLYHNALYGIYTCPECKSTTSVEREFSDDELYTGPDTLEEAWGDA
jgi:hypothetical protein